jgi:hypothetical protein
MPRKNNAFLKIIITDKKIRRKNQSEFKHFFFRNTNRMLGNILVLTPIRKGSGNLSTATRIVNSLNGSYKNVYLKNSLDYDAYDGALHRFCIENQIIALVIIHAYYSGRLFFNENSFPMPIICIFGGTDLHTPLKFWSPVIEKTMQISKYLVCFSDELKKLACVQYKNADEKCFIIIPQGVDVFVTNGIFLNDTLSGLFSNNRKVITWAGCIRKIKDPLFIGMNIFSIAKKS